MKDDWELLTNRVQIKNAVAIAQALAEDEQTQVSLGHIQLAIQSSVDFQADVMGTAYLNQTYT